MLNTFLFALVFCSKIWVRNFKFRAQRTDQEEFESSIDNLSDCLTFTICNIKVNNFNSCWMWQATHTYASSVIFIYQFVTAQLDCNRSEEAIYYTWIVHFHNARVTFRQAFITKLISEWITLNHEIANFPIWNPKFLFFNHFSPIVRHIPVHF